MATLKTSARFWLTPNNREVEGSMMNDVVCCELCRSSQLQVIEAQSPPQRVLRCDQCGLVFVHPHPHKKALRQHYDEGYYSAWMNSQRCWRRRMWTNRLRKIEHWKSCGKLLDIGCGEGHFLKVAKAKGWEICGTEISQFGSEQASAILGRSIFCGEVWEAGFAAGTFDVVTLWHVLEHVTEPLQVMREANRLLKPDGIVVLAVPNVNNRFMQGAYRLIKGRRPLLYSADDKEVHLYHFSVDTIKALLKLARFRCCSIGPDFGIVGPAKQFVNFAATLLFYLAKRHLYNAFEVVAVPLDKPHSGTVQNYRRAWFNR